MIPHKSFTTTFVFSRRFFVCFVVADAEQRAVAAQE